LSTAEQDSKQKEAQQERATAAFHDGSLYVILSGFRGWNDALRQRVFMRLLLPVLSIALGKPAEANYDGIPVESERLRNWFSITLNGVRGQGGELILDE
jgi:hypothetical protein